MSNGPDLSTLAQLYRELGQIVDIPTKREIKLQSMLNQLFALAGHCVQPNETMFDCVVRLLQAGIEAEGKSPFYDPTQVQVGWARANGLEIDGD